MFYLFLWMMAGVEEFHGVKKRLAKHLPKTKVPGTLKVQNPEKVRKKKKKVGLE